MADGVVVAPGNSAWRRNRPVVRQVPDGSGLGPIADRCGHDVGPASSPHAMCAVTARAVWSVGWHPDRGS